MKLTRIVAENIRGRALDLALSGRDIILGPNGAGKTTALDSIDLALQGYIRRIGAKPDAVLPLFDDGALSVGVDALNGEDAPLRVRRSYRRKAGKTGVSVEQGIRIEPSDGGKGVRDAEATIRSRFGAVPAALDLAELMDLTPRLKRKFVFGFADLRALGLDRAGVLSRVRELVLTPEVEADGAKTAAAKAWLEKLGSAWATAEDVEDGLERLGTWAETELRSWKRQLAEVEASMRTMADQVVDTGAGGDPAATEAERVIVQGELSALQQQLAIDDERRRGIQARAKAIEDARRRIEWYSKPGPEEDVSMAAAALETQRADLEALDVPCSEVIAHAEVECDAMRRQMADLSAELRVDAENEATSLKAIASLQRLSGQACPTCQRQMSAGECRDLIKAMDADRVKLVAELVDKERELLTLQDLATAARQELAELRERVKSAATLRAAIGAIEVSIEKADGLRLLREERMQVQERRVQQLQAEDAAAAPVVEAEAIRCRVAALEGQLVDLAKRLGAEHAARARIGIQLQAAKSKLVAWRNVDVLGAIKVAVGPNGLQGEVVRRLAGPLCEAANAVLARAGQMRLGLRLRDERGDETFDLGWDLGKGFIGWAQLSTGQRAIVGAAIVVAILGLTRPPLRVLKVDGIEVLDQPNCRAFLAALAGFGPELDNVILAGVELQDVAGEGWTVHRLGPDGMDQARCRVVEEVHP